MVNSRLRRKYIIGGVFFLLVVVGIGAAAFLTQQNQDIRQQASGSLYDASGCESSGQKLGGKVCQQIPGVTGEYILVETSNPSPIVVASPEASPKVDSEPSADDCESLGQAIGDKECHQIPGVSGQYYLAEPSVIPSPEVKASPESSPKVDDEPSADDCESSGQTIGDKECHQIPGVSGQYYLADVPKTASKTNDSSADDRLDNYLNNSTDITGAESGPVIQNDDNQPSPSPKDSFTAGFQSQFSDEPEVTKVEDDKYGTEDVDETTAADQLATVANNELNWWQNLAVDTLTGGINFIDNFNEMEEIVSHDVALINQAITGEDLGEDRLANAVLGGYAALELATEVFSLGQANIRDSFINYGYAYSEINRLVPDDTYLQRAFNNVGIAATTDFYAEAASGFLPDALARQLANTTGSVIQLGQQAYNSRDIVGVNVQNFLQDLGPGETYYIVGVGNVRDDGTGNLTLVETGESIGTTEDFSGHKKISDPVIIGNTVITSNTFEEGGWHDTVQAVDSQLQGDINLRAVNSAFHDNLNYYEPLADLYDRRYSPITAVANPEPEVVNSDNFLANFLSTSSNNDDISATDVDNVVEYQDTTTDMEWAIVRSSREFKDSNLGDTLDSNKGVCIEFAIAEQAYLELQGFEAELATSPGLPGQAGHAFVIVKNYLGKSWVADPTSGAMVPMDNYLDNKSKQRIRSYLEENGITEDELSEKEMDFLVLEYADLDISEDILEDV